MLADYVVPARIARMSRRRQKRALIVDLQACFDAKRLPLPWPYQACKVRGVNVKSMGTRYHRVDSVDVFLEPIKPVESISVDYVVTHPCATFKKT